MQHARNGMQQWPGCSLTCTLQMHEASKHNRRRGRHVMACGQVGSPLRGQRSYKVFLGQAPEQVQLRRIVIDGVICDDLAAVPCTLVDCSAIIGPRSRLLRCKEAQMYLQQECFDQKSTVKMSSSDPLSQCSCPFCCSTNNLQQPSKSPLRCQPMSRKFTCIMPLRKQQVMLQDGRAV